MDSINIYDSLRRPTSRIGRIAEKVIASTMHTSSPRIQVVIPLLQQQRTGITCGLFALVFAYHVCSGGGNIQMVRFQENRMHDHFLECIRSGKMTPFPSSVLQPHCKQPATKTRTIDVYCVCRMPDNGEKMICCDRCLEWFHFSCLGLKSSDRVVKKKVWLCSSCC